MDAKIQHIHHVGHVVRDMSAALELYRNLGFTCPSPAYPTMAEKEGEAPKPFGAANTHAAFLRNFIEIVTVVEDGGQIPDNAKLVSLQAPPAVLPRILENIRRTVATVSRCLSRYEGTHILCFSTSNVEASAAQFHTDGVRHSGVNAVEGNRFTVMETSAGDIFVPASAAHGTAIVFRQ
jgi:catechol 2,3-dioxygenase-like lactoylglutathione lyase family enzyme